MLRRLLLPAAVALLGLIANLVVATSMAATADESVHVAYGLAVLRGTPDRTGGQFDSKMPVSALNALPGALAGRWPRYRRLLEDPRAARYATIAVAACLSLVVFAFAASLYGRAAGLFAQVVFTLDPNLIAHGTLATTDLYIAFGVVLFLYALRRFLLAPNWKTAVLLGLALGFAQLTKFTAVYLCFVFAAAVPFALRRIAPRRFALLLTLAILCFAAVLNAGFLFDRSFTPLARYQLRSRTFQSLAKIPVLRSIPLPLPYPYVQGFDWMSYNNAAGVAFGNIVLLGEVRGPDLPRSDGFPTYYLVAYALKEPLGMQLLLLIGLVAALRGRRLADLAAAEGPMLATAALFMIMLSLFSRTQIGIRHILPVLAIGSVLSGAAFRGWETFSPRRRWTLIALLAWAAVSVATYYPRMIPYFNEIVTDRKLAYRYLADSNLDWGQDFWEVQRFLKDNPDVRLDPPARAPGRILVSANLMAGVWPRKADYFLRSTALLPVAHVGYAHLLYIIPAP